MSDILTKLANVLEARKGADKDASYVARLYADGLDAILNKIDEEAGEMVDAARSDDQQQIVHEAADLWFHTLVLLAHRGLGPTDILRELERRLGTPGLEEKARRKTHKVDAKPPDTSEN